MNDFLLAVTKRSWVAVVLGLLALTVAGYMKYKATGDNAFASEADLLVITGRVAEVNEVSLTSTDRRGNSHTSRHYEIEVISSAGGKLAKEKLHMPISTPLSMMETVADSEGPFIAKYDPEESNEVYELSVDGQTLRSYAETAAMRKETFVAAASIVSRPLIFVIAGAIFLLGVAGIVFHVRLRRRARTLPGRTAIVSAA